MVAPVPLILTAPRFTVPLAIRVTFLLMVSFCEYVPGLTIILLPTGAVSMAD